MNRYMPDIYQQSIYKIDYQKLKKRGITCLLFDLDNTLVPAHIKEPNSKIKELFDSLKQEGFMVVLFSNSGKKRLQPFKDYLEVDCCARACKPFRRKFLSVLQKLHVRETEVAIIGDQIMTDILGGNRVGITTILINPVSKRDFILTNITRFWENRVINQLGKKNLFLKGKYYD